MDYGETTHAPENVALPNEALSEEEEEYMRSKGIGKEKSGTKGKVARLIEMLPPEIRET